MHESRLKFPNVKRHSFAPVSHAEIPVRCARIMFLRFIQQFNYMLQIQFLCQTIMPSDFCPIIVALKNPYSRSMIVVIQTLHVN